jgi:ADP-heptose:LPS heptosyltransferase
LATFIAPIGSGLGDVIVTLPLIFALIQRGETYLVARSPRQEGMTNAIGGLAGTVREPSLSQTVRPGNDVYVNLRTHKLQTDYVWGGLSFARDYPNYRVEDILKVMAQDWQIDACWFETKKLAFTHMPAFSETIILVPGTTTISKTWPVEHWTQIVTELSQLGAPFMVLGEPDRSSVVAELIELGMPWIATERIQDAIDIISSAKAVLSVDTGLHHIAVSQGIPTVAFYQGYPLYYRERPNCFPIFSKLCPSTCLQDLECAAPNAKLEYSEFAWFDGTFGKCLAAPGTSCMDSIEPQAVLSRLAEAAGLNLSKRHRSKIPAALN